MMVGVPETEADIDDSWFTTELAQIHPVHGVAPGSKRNTPMDTDPLPD